MGSLYDSAEEKALDHIREVFPDFNWDRFIDINRSLNAELWHGPLPEDYWTYADPLEHYVWPGSWTKAADDLQELLEELPHEIWIDEDGFIYLDDPENDDENYEVSEDGDYIAWIGPYYFSTTVAKLICSKEVYNHVY